MNKILKFSSILLLFFFILIPIYSMDFQGILFVDYYGTMESDHSYTNLRNRYYFQPSFSGGLFDDAMEYEISANLFYDPLGDSSFVSTDNFVEPENILREAYIVIPLGNFDFSIGQKTVSPGMTDVFSPLNNINGSYTYKLSLDDPYDSSRADFMMQIQYYPTFDDSIQFVYVPFPRPDYESAKTLNMLYPGSNIDVDFNFDADPYLSGDKGSFFLSYSHMSPDFDFQIDYAFYTEQTPNFDLGNLNYGSGLTGTVNSIYTRNHTFGAAYSTGFNGVTLVEELAANITEDFSGVDIGIKNSDITLNSQITGTLLGGVFAQLNVIYQYVINFDENDLKYSDNINSLLEDEFNNYFNQPVQNIAFLIGHLHKSFLREKLYLALNAGFFFSTDVYLAPRIAYSLSDRINIETGADIKTGEPSSYFLARGNLLDNFFVRLKYEY